MSADMDLDRTGNDFLTRLIAIVLFAGFAWLASHWKSGTAWSASEAERVFATVTDADWVHISNSSPMMKLRKKFEYRDTKKKTHTFTAYGDWIPKRFVDGRPVDWPFTRVSHLTPPDSAEQLSGQVYFRNGLSVPQMADEIGNAKQETLAIKYLKSDPAQWRNAARDDKGGYEEELSGLKWFLLVGLPGFLAVVNLLVVLESVVGLSRCPEEYLGTWVWRNESETQGTMTLKSNGYVQGRLQEYQIPTDTKWKVQKDKLIVSIPNERDKLTFHIVDSTTLHYTNFLRSTSDPLREQHWKKTENELPPS